MHNFYNLSKVGTQALLDELGAVARGVLVIQVMPLPYSPSSAIAAEYLALLKDQRGIAPKLRQHGGIRRGQSVQRGREKGGRNLIREGFVDTMDSLQKFNLGGFV